MKMSESLCRITKNLDGDSPPWTKRGGLLSAVVKLREGLDVRTEKSGRNCLSLGVTPRSSSNFKNTYFAIRGLLILQDPKMSLTTHPVIQKEVKLYHQGELLHRKWNGQSEAWDAGNVSWQGGLTMRPLGSDWMCSKNSIYWEADLGPNTSLPCIGSMQVSKTAQRCMCMHVSCSVMSTSVTPWTIVHQDLLPMEFSRQEYWVAIPFSRGSFQPRDRIWVSCIAGISKLIALSNMIMNVPFS